MKHNSAITISALAAAAFAISTSGAWAQNSILVSDTIATAAENPGIFNSSLSGTSVENFSGMGPGIYKNLNWSGVGTIDQVSLIKDNQYGGVPGTSTYPVQSESSSLGGISKSTITLNKQSSYFGIYWSAGDPGNIMSFYNGNNLVGTFSTQSLMSKLPAGYDGNPNKPNLHQDPGEPFGFVNFTGLNGVSWNKIVLSNPSGSGFESDNWTTRVNSWNPVKDGTLPGTPITVVTTSKGVSTTQNVSQVTTTGGKITIATVNSAGKKTVSSFVPSAPGAPAPPLTACLAFAGVLLLQTLRSRKIAA